MSKSNRRGFSLSTMNITALEAVILALKATLGNVPEAPMAQVTFMAGQTGRIEGAPSEVQLGYLIGKMGTETAEEERLAAKAAKELYSRYSYAKEARRGLQACLTKAEALLTEAKKPGRDAARTAIAAGITDVDAANRWRRRADMPISGAPRRPSFDEIVERPEAAAEYNAAAAAWYQATLAELPPEVRAQAQGIRVEGLRNRTRSAYTAVRDLEKRGGVTTGTAGPFPSVRYEDAPGTIDAFEANVIRLEGIVAAHKAAAEARKAAEPELIKRREAVKAARAAHINRAKQAGMSTNRVPTAVTPFASATELDQIEAEVKEAETRLNTAIEAERNGKNSPPRPTAKLAVVTAPKAETVENAPVAGASAPVSVDKAFDLKVDAAAKLANGTPVKVPSAETLLTRANGDVAKATVLLENFELTVLDKKCATIRTGGGARLNSRDAALVERRDGLRKKLNDLRAPVKAAPEAQAAAPA